MKPNKTNNQRIHPPKALEIDGEIFTVEHVTPDSNLLYVFGARMCLSPAEVEELINWLKGALKYITVQNE